MKILYLHQYFVTPEMGGGVRSYEMGRRLVAAGHEVDVITSSQQGQSDRLWRISTESGIKVHWANVRYRNDMGFLRRIASFFAFAILATQKALTVKADIIYATSTPLTIAIPALIASAVRGIPFVFEVRDLWPDVPVAIGALRNPVAVWLARKLEALSYRRASHIVTVAPGMREEIIAKGVPEGKVSVVTQGCDLDFFSEASRAASPRTQYAWLGSRKMVLYAGAIGIVNGVDWLVRVASETLKTDPEIRFVIIGAGKQVGMVEALASDLGVLNRNLYIFGKMSKSRIVPWFSAADVHLALFTGPSIVWKDTLQNKFFDALMAGKPIANNFAGWQSRFAESEGVGIFLDPNDILNAACSLVKAINNKPWLESVSVKAKALAKGPFNRDNLAKRIEGILLTVVQKA